MFKLSVCWVPGELRPLLGRQRVYVSWMYLWKLRLVNSSSLYSFLRDGFFPQKSINHIFFTTARKCVKIYYEVFKRTSWKSNWKSPVKKNWQAYNNCIFNRCYYLLFLPFSHTPSKKRGLKRNPHHHYWGIITQSSFIPDRVSGLFCASFFNGYKRRFAVVTYTPEP